MDLFKNFARATVSGTHDASDVNVNLDLNELNKFPNTIPYNAVWYDSTLYPDPTNDPNVEVVRITGTATNQVIVTRGQEGTSASTKNTSSSTYKLTATLTAKTLNSDIVSISGDQNITGVKSFDSQVKFNETLNIPDSPNTGYVIDVTKLNNVIAITGATELSFSATPPTGTIFGAELIESGGSGWAVTVPTGYSQDLNANISSFTLLANQVANISWRYDGSGYTIYNQPYTISDLDEEISPNTGDLIEIWKTDESTHKYTKIGNAIFGDTVQINGNDAADANFRDGTPAVPNAAVNVKWQYQGASPTSISAYIPLGRGITGSSNEVILDIFGIPTNNTLVSDQDFLVWHNTSSSVTNKTLIDNLPYHLKRTEVVNGSLVTTGEFGETLNEERYTGAYILNTGDVKHKLVTNYGMGGTGRVVIRQFTGSAQFDAVSEATGNLLWKIFPPSGESFNLTGTNLTRDNSINLDTTIGSRAEFLRIRTGDVLWQWHVYNHRGTHIDGGT